MSSRRDSNRNRRPTFFDYRQIPTPQEYLLINPKRPCVEQYVRQAENQWLLTVWQGISQKLPLPSLQIALKISMLALS
ncbi:putative endonuclease DUF820 family [Thermosynechococcus sp. NK55a]|nr:putative endonuclease DUF820 family [Thermosynechococcus sp. NK55a]